MTLAVVFTILGVSVKVAAPVLAIGAKYFYNNNIKPWMRNLSSGSSGDASRGVYTTPIELRLLGFPDSGKTQFLNALQNKPNPSEKKQTTAVQDLPLFNISCGYSVKTIHAKDANGSEEYLKKTIIQFVEEADYVLFLCDVVKYLAPKDSSIRDSNNRVIRAIQELSKNKSKKIYIILSHADELNKLNLTEQNAIVLFKELIRLAPYYDIPCYTLNTCNQNDVRDLFQKIIKN